MSWGDSLSRVYGQPQLFGTDEQVTLVTKLNKKAVPATRTTGMQNLPARDRMDVI